MQVKHNRNPFTFWKDRKPLLEDSLIVVNKAKNTLIIKSNSYIPRYRINFKNMSYKSLKQLYSQYPKTRNNTYSYKGMNK